MGNVNKILERVNSQKQPEYSRGEIYYIEKAYTTGMEQQAGRPAVIVSNDTGNRFSDCVTVVYLTTRPKNELPTHVEIKSAQHLSIVLCETISTVSKERIGNYYGTTTEKEMEEIEDALQVALGLKPEPRKEKKPEEAETVEAAKKEAGKALKEAAFYKMMYEDAMEKMKHFALGGLNQLWQVAA